MGRKPSKVVKIGDIFHTWEVISRSEGYSYECKCINCTEKKVINKYNLLRNTYAICKKCGIKSILESNIDVVLRYWNTDLNNSSLDEILGNPTATYWFTCGRGHNFRKTLRDFTPESCPTCKKLKKPDEASVRMLKGDTFSKCYPHLMEFWNYRKNKDKPTDVQLSINKKKYWFICSEGHEFCRTPLEIRKGKWCPYCEDTFFAERLKIITQAFCEATFGDVYFNDEDDILVVDSQKIAIAIYGESYNFTFFNQDFPSQKNTNILYNSMKIKKKYTSLGYDFIVFYATKNLEKDVDLMKNSVLDLI